MVGAWVLVPVVLVPGGAVSLICQSNGRIKARAHVGLAVLADRSDLSRERQMVQQALLNAAHHFIEVRVGVSGEPFAVAAPSSWKDEGGVEVAALVAGSWPSSCAWSLRSSSWGWRVLESSVFIVVWCEEDGEEYDGEESGDFRHPTNVASRVQLETPKRRSVVLLAGTAHSNGGPEHARSSRHLKPI